MIESVPRGTKVVGLRFTEAMYQAAAREWKGETRRPLTRGNCQLSRGDFASIDFTSARPDLAIPVSRLQARAESESGDRRSVLVTPRILPGMAVWCRRGQAGAAAQRKNAAFLLAIEEVQARRLQDITETEALNEGVLIFCPPEKAFGDRATMLCEAYAFQLGQLGQTNAARWRAGIIHQEVRARGRATARDCFALLWASINGLQSWATNPWVWRYRFRKVAP